MCIDSSIANQDLTKQYSANNEKNPMIAENIFTIVSAAVKPGNTMNVNIAMIPTN